MRNVPVTYLICLATVATSASAAVFSRPQAVASNPALNRIYVANSSAGTVSVIDGSKNTSATVTVGSGPSAIAVNTNTGNVYVVNSGANSVTVIDSNNSTTTIAVGSAPSAVAVNPVTNKIYVANSSGASVTVIDAGNSNATTTVTVGTTPAALAVNELTNVIYVANQQSNNVSVINGSNGSVTATVTVGTGPQAIVVNPVSNKIYTANAGSSNVSVFSGGSTTATAIATGSSPVALAFNPVTNRVYAANYLGASVTVIDGSADSVVTTVAAGTNPSAISANPLTNQIYATNYGSNSLTAIDGSTNAASTKTTGTGPWAVTVNPITNRIYTTNSGSGDFTMLDGATYKTATISVASPPGALAVNPVTNKIYTANPSAGTVTVVDGSNNTTTTVNAGGGAGSVALNPITNKIYVANSAANSITVIDGATSSTTTLSAGSAPSAVAVNPVTNKIYVTNTNNNTVTVVDGGSNATSTILSGSGPSALAVNPVTNKIYVLNGTSRTVTVIDGPTNSTASVNIGGGSVTGSSIALNAQTNKVYITNDTDGTVTVIDGATNTAALVTVGGTPRGVSVNTATNKIYVANNASATVSVIDGVSNSVTTTVTVAASPANVLVNATTNKIYVTSSSSSTITVIDGVVNSATAVTASQQPGSLALNPTTGTVYAGNLSSILTVISEQQMQPVPLTTAVTPIANNTTTATSLGFFFTAQDLFSPNATAIQNTYFQFDGWQGPWTPVTTLSPGLHFVYAFSVDGQDSTATQPASPLVGQITAYQFLVKPAGNLLTLLTNPAAGGTISASPSSTTGFYDPATSVTITAAAASGYLFSGFTGDLSTTANSQTLSMSASRTVTANFTCTYAVTSGGSPISTINASPAGATGIITVTTGSGCNWTTSIPAGYVTANPIGGTGSGTTTYTIQANPGGARSTTFTVAGASITVNQSGATAPTADSVTPSSGTGATQLFTGVYSDTSGASQVRGTLMLFDTSIRTDHTCLAAYDPVVGGFFLYTDTGSLSSAIAAGGSGVLQNSQCSLNVGSSSVSSAGSSLSVRFSITFKAGFTGAKNIYLLTYDYGASGTSLNSGWQARGTWTPSSTAATAPTADSVSPNTGTGQTQLFTGVYSDAAGASQVRGTLMLFETTIKTDHTCLPAYDPVVGGFFLYDDNGALTSPIAAGTAGTIQNSQCLLNAGNSTVTSAGNSVTVRFAITFKAGFSGAKNIYLLAYDYGASGSVLNSGWQNRGTWTPTSSSVTAPTADSVSPSSGGGLTQLFTGIYSDASGASQVRGTLMLFDATIKTDHTCLAAYDPVVGGFFLYDDNGALTAPIAAGGSGTIQNSQCSLNVGGSSVSSAGNSVTVKFSITFKSGFTGTKNIYLLTYDYGASGTSLNSGWQNRGTWTTAAVVSPTADSVTPSSGSGMSQLFAGVYSDASGASQIRGTLMLFDTAVKTDHTCLAAYDPVVGGFFLYDDTGALTSPIAAGGAGVIQNSQCSLNVGASSLLSAGNSLTVRFSITFKAGFAGTKNIYLLTYDYGASGTSLNSGWQNRGTWTPSPLVAPTADSVSPNSGNGASQLFAGIYSDTGGASQVRGTFMLFETTIKYDHTCLAGYDPVVGGFFLYDDNANLITPIPAGGSGVLQNSQCSLNVGASSLSSAGNSLTVRFSITFKSGFAGAKNIYMLTYDKAASGTTLDSGWQTRGIWTPF